MLYPQSNIITKLSIIGAIKFAKLLTLNIFATSLTILKLYANIVITNDKNIDNLIKKSLETEYLKGLEQYLSLILGILVINIVGYSTNTKQVIMAQT